MNYGRLRENNYLFVLYRENRSLSRRRHAVASVVTVAFDRLHDPRAYCSLRNEMGRNEMEICSLRNENL